MRWAEAATGSSAALRLGEAHGVDLVGGGDASGAREADGTRLRWRSWSESEDAVEEKEE
eukprot:CAMPEP_0169472556 /NCGR_PEP_ID=MMETSP1042-20121227/25225_1 /TAXON_ID=464988 /ORGANISM="Hemiselmis andersenii, Strain CCMP1180" /LENGTH=58 /DNA_ID=CAMNT_0009586405 /DNA_START=294 /DNA_END=470 /DNA_ORIENTATION=+